MNRVIVLRIFEGHKIRIMLVFSGYLSSIGQAMRRTTNGAGLIPLVVVLDVLM